MCAKTPSSSGRRPIVPNRSFRDSEGPLLAALLSDRSELIDNLNALTAFLDGVRAADVPIDIRGSDLTDSRIYVRIQAEGVAACNC